MCHNQTFTMSLANGICSSETEQTFYTKLKTKSHILPFIQTNQKTCSGQGFSRTLHQVCVLNTEQTVPENSQVCTSCCILLRGLSKRLGMAFSFWTLPGTKAAAFIFCCTESTQILKGPDFECQLPKTHLEHDLQISSIPFGAALFKTSAECLGTCQVPLTTVCNPKCPIKILTSPPPVEKPGLRIKPTSEKLSLFGQVIQAVAESWILLPCEPRRTDLTAVPNNGPAFLSVPVTQQTDIKEATVQSAVTYAQLCGCPACLSPFSVFHLCSSEQNSETKRKLLLGSHSHNELFSPQQPS